MYKILITGDSWGCGEWGNYKGTTPIFSGRKKGISHLGFEQYLLDDGHEVSNLSIGGINNLYVINHVIKPQLDKHWDYIFWFQSDPLRDTKFLDLNFKWFDTFEDLLEIQNEFLNISYKELNSLNIPIYCLGGCSKINLELIKVYKNLIPIIPSITEFLIPGYSHPLIWFSGDWYKKINELWSLETIEHLLSQRKIMDNLRLSPYFQVDTGHPDRYGHKKIFEYVKEKLKL